jgi:ubiquinone/menaquinone biosynthesis C-methylase UbiE
MTEIQPIERNFRIYVKNAGLLRAYYYHMIETIRSLLNKTAFKNTPKSSIQAYEIWSETYDKQPGNLMLDLDEKIFADLIETIDLKNKGIADIGCGTGRHWEKLYKKQPAFVMGFDVSTGMLRQLLRKYPAALTHHTTDNLMKQIPDNFVDCLVTTLTIAHIEDIEEGISAWSRVVKQNGDLVITDFHPEMLARGGKRSFRQGNRSLSVKNFIHSLEKLERILTKYNFSIVKRVERKVDEKVKNYYESQQAVSVYNRFFGTPVIYGIHLRKNRATE